jgi:hypothetical protein
MFQAHLHQLRQGVEPRDSVVNLEDRLTSRLEDPAAFADEPLRVGRVLDNPMRVDRIKRVIGKREMLTVGDLKRPLKPLLSEVRLCQLDCRRGQIHTSDVRAPTRKTREVDARAATDLENRAATISVEVDEPQQMVQLLEVVLIEVVEETTRADRVARDFEVVNVLFPVTPDLTGSRHAGQYTNGLAEARLNLYERRRKNDQGR